MKYQKSLQLGQELMNEFPIGSWHYEKGQKIVAWACEKIREEQNVKLFYPGQIGSLEEKLEVEAFNNSNE